MYKLKHAIGRKIGLFAVGETIRVARRCHGFQPAEINISNGMRIDVVHRGPSSLRLGIVVADRVDPGTGIPRLDLLIADRLQELAQGLSEERDAYRGQVRNVFRNGRYKPTGRSKPASEYLLRAASEDRFPRINSLVDTCNYLSVASLMPISIWDLDRAALHAWQVEGDDPAFEFRLGAVDESYVFNQGGQEISVEDLIVGAVLSVDADSPHTRSLPIVNAVKDSQATKTSAATRRVAAAIYAPMADGPDLSLDEVCDLFCELLGATSTESRCTRVILGPGELSTLHV